jgi:hypothetical protein
MKKLVLLFIGLLITGLIYASDGPPQYGLQSSSFSTINTCNSDFTFNSGIDAASTTTYTRPYPSVTNAVRNTLVGMPTGAGIINSASDVLDIYNSSRWNPQSSAGIVYWNDASDIPHGGILEANKTYVFRGLVVVSSKPLVFPDIGECNLDGGAYIYTGSTAMLQGNFQSYNSREIRHVFFQCAHPSGTFFNITASGAGLGAPFILDDVGLASLDGVNHGAYSIGTVKNVTPVFQLTQFLDVDNGLTFSNCIDGSALKTVRVKLSTDVAGTCITYNGTLNNIIEVDGYFPLLNTDQYGINFDSSSIFNGVVYRGGGAILSGDATYDNLIDPDSFDQTTIGFKFASNVGIPDSTAEIKLTLTDNLTVTTFTAVNVPTLVTGTWVPGSERFEGTIYGRATYTGLEDASMSIISNPTAVTGIGTNKDVSFYYVHGNETTNTITSFADAGGGLITATSSIPLVDEKGDALSDGARIVINNTTNYDGTFVSTNVTTYTFDFTDTFVDTDTGDWGVILETSIAQNQLGSTTKASCTMVIDSIVFETNDYIELFIENNTDGLSLRVKNCVMVLTKN